MTDTAPKENITVRPAEPDDLPAVAELRWRWILENGENGENGETPPTPTVEHAHFISHFITWAQENASTHRCTVLVRDTVITGMAWLAVLPRVPSPHARTAPSVRRPAVRVRRTRGTGRRRRRPAHRGNPGRGKGPRPRTGHRAPLAPSDPGLRPPRLRVLRPPAAQPRGQDDAVPMRQHTPDPPHTRGRPPTGGRPRNTSLRPWRELNPRASLCRRVPKPLGHTAMSGRSTGLRSELGETTVRRGGWGLKTILGAATGLPYAVHERGAAAASCLVVPGSEHRGSRGGN